MRHVSDTERRARLGVRHALADGARLDSPEAVTRALVVLHATEPASVYLSGRARSDALTVADLDRALYRDRSLVKQLAMRRTLFVFPIDLLPAAWASSSARVAGFERTRMVNDIVRAGIAADGEAWLDAARSAVLAVLADSPAGLPADQIRRAAPVIDVRVTVSPSASWTASRVLTHLGLTGDIVRGVNLGSWRTSRPRWTLTRNWLGEPPAPISPADGYRELVRRWLTSFGPGTEDDLVWWLGATKAAVRTALAQLDTVEVSLDHDRTGWLLAEDTEVQPDPGRWVALLPTLDPTVMGWRHREFYLGPHRDQLFDRNGNAGPTAWLNGRVVGGWVQDDDGRVRLRLLEDVGRPARRELDREADRLTMWLDGALVNTVIRTPATVAQDEPVTD